MKRFPLIGILISVLSFVFLANRIPLLTGEFKIDPSSQLRLEGTTNVNRFSCNCQENFPKDTYQVIPQSLPYILNLRNTDFRLSIAKLDCGRKGINNDLQKALKAETFPYIHIEVQSIRLPEDARPLDPETWVTVPVKTQISVAGTRKPLHLAVQVKALEDNTYLLRSRTEIAMSEFGIDPPKPLLGMIKVEDIISIYFDLKVEI